MVLQNMPAAMFCLLTIEHRMRDESRISSFFKKLKKGSYSLSNSASKLPSRSGVFPAGAAEDCC